MQKVATIVSELARNMVLKAAWLKDKGRPFGREASMAKVFASETAKKVSAAVRDAKLKKVTANIQGEQVRVQSPDKDALQDAIALLRKEDFGVELQFGNFR